MIWLRDAGRMRAELLGAFAFAFKADQREPDSQDAKEADEGSGANFFPRVSDVDVQDMAQHSRDQ